MVRTVSVDSAPAAADPVTRAVENHLPTVLVVEDDFDIRQLVATHLRRHGLNIVTACDGLEALAKVEIIRPDLVLLDIMLPRRDGFQVLSQLRLNGDHVPVVMLSARCSRSDVSRGFELGADDYIVKPFSRTDLLQRVRKLVDTKRLDTASVAIQELVRLAYWREPERCEPPSEL